MAGKPLSGGMILGQAPADRGTLSPFKTGPCSSNALFYGLYPPPAVFHEGLMAHDYAMAISALPERSAAAVSLNIPFCREPCPYDRRPASVTHRNERITHYMVAVRQEMKLLAGLVRKPLRLGQLYVGGGVPNILTDRLFKDLFASLHRYFDVQETCETAVETDPRYVTARQVKNLMSCGVTSAVIKIPGSFAGSGFSGIEIEEAYGCLRDAGIRSITLMALGGLPEQTPAALETGMNRVCGLSPDRIVLPYVFSSGLKPSILDLVRNMILGKGYQPIGIDHFVKPGDGLALAAKEKRLWRDGDGCKSDPPCVRIGLGAGSLSRVNDALFENAPQETSYREALEKGRLATVRGCALDPEDVVRSAIIEELTSYLSCDVDEICRRYNYPAIGLADALKKLESFETSGLVSRKDMSLTLNKSCGPSIVSVLQAFDRYAIPPDRESQAA